MIRIMAMAAAIVFLAACSKTLPVRDVENAEIFTSSGKEPTLEQVRKAVVEAVVVKTWQIEKDDPHKVQAALHKGTKLARIVIEYSTKKYSIRYKDSTRLLYEDGKIHRRYNAWIEGLKITIDKNLARL